MRLFHFLVDRQSNRTGFQQERNAQYPVSPNQIFGSMRVPQFYYAFVNRVSRTDTENEYRRDAVTVAPSNALSQQRRRGLEAHLSGFRGSAAAPRGCAHRHERAAGNAARGVERGPRSQRPFTCPATTSTSGRSLRARRSLACPLVVRELCLHGALDVAVEALGSDRSMTPSRSSTAITRGFTRARRSVARCAATTRGSVRAARRPGNR